MSSSEPDSDCSNMMKASPQSYTESPYSSPSQHVPEITNCLTSLSCVGEDSIHINGKTTQGRCQLKIIEEPQNHFRFRYRSEMAGTHGCLLGRTSTSNKTKTHPSVKLMNYNGRAKVCCSLAQVINDNDHPHQLLEEEYDRDVCAEVGPEKGYIVRFPGLGIIHTAKKEVPRVLFKKHAPILSHQGFTHKQILNKCEQEAKTINLNIVRLKFSAHDINTDAEICHPVYSEPIHNMKSAATNDLKICRISKRSGPVSGGQDVFILVEKVNKNNIEVRFYEVSPDGDEIWSAKAMFNKSDVHHQYAIVFRTPPYKDQDTKTNKTVYVELIRPSDKRRSTDQIEYIYKPDRAPRSCKKRKTASYSSFDSTSSSSIKSVAELPTSVYQVAKPATYPDYNMESFRQSSNMSFMPMAGPSSSEPLADALYTGVASNIHLPQSQLLVQSPLLSQTGLVPHLTHSQPPQIQLTSTERDLDKMLVDTANIPSEDLREFLTDFKSDEFRDAYFKQGHNLQDEEVREMSNSLHLLTTSINLTADSAAKTVRSQPKISKIEVARYQGNFEGRIDVKNIAKFEEDDELQEAILSYDMKDKNEYNATYSHKDGTEVKQLAKELCDMTRHKIPNRSELKNKLDTLLSIRLNNGDTFLHMTLCKGIYRSFDFIVKVISQLQLFELLNLCNDKGQTILHSAIMYGLSNKIEFLISKGCDPMLKDARGNNALHYAALYRNSMSELLLAIKNKNLKCDIDAYNDKRQTALHVAAVGAAGLGAGAGAEGVAAAGAAGAAQLPDALGRLPLHLTAYDRRLPELRALLALPQVDVNAVDARGNTALQIACDGPPHKDVYQMVKLLLEKKADPLKSENNTESAWQLVQNKEELRLLLLQYISHDDIKIEIKEEYDSSEDEEEDHFSDCISDTIAS